LPLRDDRTWAQNTFGCAGGQFLQLSALQTVHGMPVTLCCNLTFASMPFLTSAARNDAASSESGAGIAHPSKQTPSMSTVHGPVAHLRQGAQLESARQYPDGCGAHAAGMPPRRAAPPCGVPDLQHLVHRCCAVPLQQWPAASAADRHQRQHNKMSPPAPAPGTTTRQQPTDLALRVTEHTQQLQRRGSPVQRAAAPVHATIHCSHVV